MHKTVFWRFFGLLPQNDILWLTTIAIYLCVTIITNIIEKIHRTHYYICKKAEQEICDDKKS